MKASPAAAAVPARKAVGRFQKSGNVVRMPKAASESAIIAGIVWLLSKTPRTSPVAPK